MSTAVQELRSRTGPSYIVRRTVEACHLAKEAAGSGRRRHRYRLQRSAEFASPARAELDTLDMEIDSGVTDGHH